MHALKTCQTLLAPLGTPRNQDKAPAAFFHFVLKLGISPPSSACCLLPGGLGVQMPPLKSLLCWLQSPSEISLTAFQKRGATFPSVLGVFFIHLKELSTAAG